MSDVHWGDVPTWVSAVATIAAAVGAFIAARIAFNQLKGQREAIERQGEEQARLAELQTKEMEELDHQRELHTKQLEQLAQQSELNARQIARLDQQFEVARRAQAEKITARASGFDTQFHGINPERFLIVTVTNGSGRPIRNLRSAANVNGANYPSKMACSRLPGPGEAADRRPDTQYEPVSALRGGETLHFLFTRIYVDGRDKFWLTFDDDAGIRWQLDEDMHLEGHASTS